MSTKCHFKHCSVVEVEYKKCESCKKTTYCFHHAKIGCNCLECERYVCNKCESDEKMNICKQCN